MNIVNKHRKGQSSPNVWSHLFWNIQRRLSSPTKKEMLPQVLKTEERSRNTFNPWATDSFIVGIL